jgi:A/G-specific adenine glycosylase
VRGRAGLWRWYESRRGAYPWREVEDPYRVLVSEVMLQQTQASRVVAAYGGFVRRFPSARALARASRGDVLRAWGALGYHRRAVALHEAAGRIVREHGGRVPADPDALRRLPGVGPYTAAAVASIAFGVAVPAVDTNVARVVGRFMLGRDGAGRAEIRRAAGRWLDRRSPGDWNQAVMDLGREVGRPAPRCGACPLARSCAFRRAGARPWPASRRQPAFEGSARQLRGAVVRLLREDGPATAARLSAATGRSPDEVRAAVQGLAADGVVRADRRALSGAGRGVVRL